jgi:hypothetical protein
MFDADYFRDRLPQDVREKRGTARVHEPFVRVHLHGGVTYTVARLVDVGPWWVVFDAYPKKKHRAEKTEKDVKEAKDAKREALDRVAFAYNAISHVTIAMRPIGGTGFKTDDVAAQ